MDSFLDIPIRILVTGTRGKSTLVRMLHHVISGSGLKSYARITGVIPRELTPKTENPIFRSSGGSIREMLWWLKSLPNCLDCLIVENSAVSPELQHLPALWLDPTLIVITNIREDHQELWGKGIENAAEVIMRGIFPGKTVIFPEDILNIPGVSEELEKKGCSLHGIEEDVRSSDHVEKNRFLCLACAEYLGIGRRQGREILAGLGPDIGDFGVFRVGDSLLAYAFSVNDVFSSRVLFQGLSWQEKETEILFNHRKDRPGRLKSFSPWLDQHDWKGVFIIGDRPLLSKGKGIYLALHNPVDLIQWLKDRGKVFGCGNVAGMPLELSFMLPEGREPCEQA